jgi:sulfur transfer complex TusBCD TusB component (DsrH family)
MKGNKVTLFLIQNGVLPARQGSKYAGRLAEIAKDRITVLADDFSLRERSIRHLADGVRMSGVDELVDLIMAEGTKTIWH